MRLPVGCKTGYILSHVVEPSGEVRKSSEALHAREGQDNADASAGDLRIGSTTSFERVASQCRINIEVPKPDYFVGAVLFV